MENDIKEEINTLRTETQNLADRVKGLHNRAEFEGQIVHSSHGEMRANITLAYRHFEDARMRLGKVIQAYDGGESCFGR